MIEFKDSKMEKSKFLFIFLLLLTASLYANPTSFIPVSNNYSEISDLASSFDLEYKTVGSQTTFTITNGIDAEGTAGKAMIGSVFFLATNGLSLELAENGIIDADNSDKTGVDFYLKRQLVTLPDFRDEPGFSSAVQTVYLFDSAKGNNGNSDKAYPMLKGFLPQSDGMVQNNNSADGDARVEANESISFVFDTNFIVSQALNSRNLIIGLHIQSLPKETSDSLINDTVLYAVAPPVVPAPGAVLLALSGVGMILGRRK